jgi:hypothetical protein
MGAALNLPLHWILTYTAFKILSSVFTYYIISICEKEIKKENQHIHVSNNYD